MADRNRRKPSRVRLAGGNAATAKQLHENSAPLAALGLSSWQDGDTSHVLLKITTH
ncbi:MAG: hypothetical protein M3Z50_07240 [Actinomycetota bacterium]|nr:hypothetical protein [Actinomycetota bacterium]